jgi:predicted dehydrogenase
MNISIIGAGYMGSMHARIISELPNVTLFGITAKTTTKAPSLASELKTKSLTSIKELLEIENTDIIDICTPTETHAQIACQCMEAGKHVIIEYPICSTAKELNELRKVSHRTNRICAAAYYSRFQSQYKYFYEISSSDKIGKIRSISITRKSSSVFSSKDILNNLMAQDIDFVVRLLGLPNTIKCINNNQSDCVLVFKYKSAIVTITGSTNMHNNYPFTTRHTISGINGSLILDWSFIDSPISQMVYSNDKGQSILYKDDYDPYRHELEHIINGIANNNTSDFDIDSLYKSALLTFKCRHKMKTSN